MQKDNTREVFGQRRGLAGLRAEWRARVLEPVWKVSGADEGGDP